MMGVVAHSSVHYYPVDWVFQGNPTLNPDPDYNYDRNPNLLYISMIIHLIIYTRVFQGA